MTGFLILYAISGVIIGLLAARKNRNGWAWGLIGGWFLLFGLLVLAFLPYLCPKCKESLTNKSWKSRTCPRCGDISKGTMEPTSTSSYNSSTQSPTGEINQPQPTSQVAAISDSSIHQSASKAVQAFEAVRKQIGSSNFYQDTHEIENGGTMKPNGKQRKIVIVGVVLFILMGLIPPWAYTVEKPSLHSEYPAEYAFIFSPPEPESTSYGDDAYGVKIDTSRLFIQFFVLAAATGLGVFMTRSQDERMKL